MYDNFSNGNYHSVILTDHLLLSGDKYYLSVCICAYRVYYVVCNLLFSSPGTGKNIKFNFVWTAVLFSVNKYFLMIYVH